LVEPTVIVLSCLVVPKNAGISFLVPIVNVASDNPTYTGGTTGTKKDGSVFQTIFATIAGGTKDVVDSFANLTYARKGIPNPTIVDGTGGNVGNLPDTQQQQTNDGVNQRNNTIFYIIGGVLVLVIIFLVVSKSSKKK
jgi:hypothetical protein